MRILFQIKVFHYYMASTELVCENSTYREGALINKVSYRLVGLLCGSKVALFLKDCLAQQLLMWGGRYRVKEWTALMNVGT